MNVNLVYMHLLSNLLTSENLQSPRGMATKELLGYQSVVSMEDPRVLWKTRKLSSRFQHAEAAWILSGDNRVSSIAPFNKNISPYADDGQRYFGAYGPKVIDQLPYVVAKLAQDKASRQAVINIWRENPPQTKDVPCTLSLQFLVRDSLLWCMTTMRSSDAWLGWPYDVFNFSMISRAVSIYYNQVTGDVIRPHMLVLTAGSQHLYEQHFKVAKELFDEKPLKVGKETYLPATDYVLRGVDGLVSDLWKIATES